MNTVDFNNIKPIMNIPLAAFPVDEECQKPLFYLRLNAAKTEGWFMVKCSHDDFYAAAFNLGQDYTGRWMLGKIINCPSYVGGPPRYEVFIHCGSRDTSAFCLDEQDLLEVLGGLDRHGMESVLSDRGGWGVASEDVFTSKGFVERPVDVVFEMLFGGV